MSFLLPIVLFTRTNQTTALPSTSASISSNRKFKIGEQIDSLLSQFGKSPPVLPHNEFIDDFLQKIRKKLKGMEDDEAVIRFTRFDLQNKNLTVNIRAVVSTLLHEAEILDSLKSKQSITCSYLSEIKSQVHIPLSSLLNKYSRLPSLSDSNEYYTASHLYASVESAYAVARSNPLLVHVASCKAEAEYIESEVEEMLKPLRQTAKIITKLSSVRRESVWSQSLLPLLACPTGELLARCCHKYETPTFLPT